MPWLVNSNVGSAMSLLPDGPPWLLPDEPDHWSDGVEVDAQQALPIDDVPVLDEEEANATIALLSEQQRRQEAELIELRNEIRSLKRNRRESRSSFRPHVYSDDEAQFRFEVYLSYLTRVPEAERQ